MTEWIKLKIEGTELNGMKWNDMTETKWSKVQQHWNGLTKKKQLIII